MKFYLFICFISTSLIIWAIEADWLSKQSPKRVMPEFIKNYQNKMKSSFVRPENAHILFSFFTGNKDGISPYTKKAFKQTNLSYLFSPSGVHLAGILVFILYFVKKIPTKKGTRFFKFLINIGLFFLPQFYTLHRLAVLRLSYQFNHLAKLKQPVEILFIFTFIISFCLGHFHYSPMGFIYSFIYLGTFIAFGMRPKISLILGLFSTQLILGIFFGNQASLFSIAVGLLGGFLFSLIFPLLIIFFSTFWLMEINWGEPIIRGFVLGTHYFSKILNGTYFSSSLFLIGAVWLLLCRDKPSYWLFLFTILFFLHTDGCMSPTIVRSWAN